MSRATKPPVIYLAGAIRDDRTYDIHWRARVIEELNGLAVFLNPLGGKVFNEVTREWTMSGIPSKVTAIVRHDAWCVDQADMVLADLSALAEKYPNIGTLLEVGRAWKGGKLIYGILDPGYLGHGNTGMYRLHPFLEDILAAKFDTVDDAITFLRRHLASMSGLNPHFDGLRAA